jgi:hypothetical protein
MARGKRGIESSGLPGNEDDDGAAGAGREGEEGVGRAPGAVGGERGGDTGRGG